MLLYHFTPLKTTAARGEFMRPTRKASDRIVLNPDPGGLKSMPGQGWGELRIPGGPEVVWLTTDPATSSDTNDFWFRVTVKIPSTDRRLISWPKWAGKHARWYIKVMGEKYHDEVSRFWWGYAGTIPLNRIVDIEPLEGQRPAWCREAHPRCDRFSVANP